MRLRTPLLFAGLAASIVAAFSLSNSGVGTPLARATSASSPKGPRVALLVTRPGADTTSLVLSPLGSGEASVPVLSFSHLPGAVVRGATLPGTETVVAIADTLGSKDASFAASLFRLVPHKGGERLCDEVVHASRPLVTAGGRVFVARGKAGVAPAIPLDPAALKGNLPMRVDDLSIDEVDVATGTLRTIHTYSGYLTFLAGSFENEVLVYRVGPTGADFIGVDMDTGGERMIAPNLLPFARDFSVDTQKRSVVFEERDENDPRTWVVDRMDLKTGARTRLHTSSSMALAPFAWPGGGIGLTPDGQSGMVVTGSSAKVSGPLGAGVDFVEAVSPDGAWVAASHTKPSQFGVPFAMDAKTGSVYALPAPSGAGAEIAGFVAAGGAK